MRRALVILAVVMLSLPVAAQTVDELMQDLATAVAYGASLSKFLPACDYSNVTTRDWAARHVTVSGDYTIEQVCQIFDALHPPSWTYVADPAGFLGDYVAKASESIRIGLRGDCDDFAVLMATAIRAIGGACRIFIVQGKLGGHAIAEVYIGKDDAEAGDCLMYVSVRYNVFLGNLWIDRDQGYWLLLDWDFSAKNPHPGQPLVIPPDEIVSFFYIPVLSFDELALTGSLTAPSAP